MNAWDMEWDDVVTAVTVQMRQVAAQSLPESVDADWWESEAGDNLRSEVDLAVVQTLDHLKWVVSQQAAKVKGK
jgi:hypothetical protein